MKALPAFWPPSSNFGDKLTPWLIKKITGHEAGYLPPEHPTMKALLCGSTLSQATGSTMVWGAGIGSFEEAINPYADYRSVRGPISYARLASAGVAKKIPIGDSAWVLPRLIPANCDQFGPIGVVPHFIDYYEVASVYGNYEELKIINLLNPIENVVADVCSCRQIVSSSLHGLIVAGAYGIPARWVRFSNKLAGDGTKFLDYLLSVGMEASPAVNLSTWPPLYGITSQQCFRPPRTVDDSNLWAELHRLLDDLTARTWPEAAKVETQESVESG